MKTTPVSVRLAPGIKDALDRAAKTDHRSLSAKIELILKDWLIDNDYLDANFDPNELTEEERIKARDSGRYAFQRFGHEGRIKNPFKNSDDRRDEWFAGFEEEARVGTAAEC